MKTSESISKISSALLDAQRAITFAAKDAVNPHFKSKYADLPTVIDAVKPALNESGIVFLQMAAPSEPGTLALTTRLLHVSGEWIESTAVTPLQKHDPQGYGSALTYLRRYSLAAAVGLYQDDDDGNAAANEERDPLASFKPPQQKVIRATAQAALQAFNEGNEFGAYGEVTSCVEKVGAGDVDAENRVRMALWSIFHPYPALRASLKRHSDAERNQSKEAA
jgi:hypothetical protein